MARFRDLIRRELAGAGLTEAELRALPRGYQRIGDIAIVYFPPTLYHHSRAIGEAILRIVSGVRTVCARTSGIVGDLRRPTVTVIAGELNTETTHRENGCVYELDVRKVMFSRGNVVERGRVARLVRSGEVVVDMFAGIGYFSIPIAVHGRPEHVCAIDINPVSTRYLRRNVQLNRVESDFEIYQSDCREISLRLRNIADRVLMGYLPGTERFLPAAFRFLRETGGVIHYHNIAPRRELPDGPKRLLSEYAADNGYLFHTDSPVRVVKSYAPGIVHFVVDARFTQS